MERKTPTFLLKVKGFHVSRAPGSGSHGCRSLSRFLWHEVTRSIATPSGWDASPSQVTPSPSISSGFPDSSLVPIYTPAWVERCTVRVNCLAQEQNTMTRPGVEPGPLDPESGALTTLTPRLPANWHAINEK